MISLISTQSTPPRLQWVIYNQCTDGAQSNNYNYGLSTTSTDRQTFTGKALSHTTEVKHVSFTRIYNCRIFHIFQQSALNGYFTHKLAFSTAILWLFLAPVSMRFRFLDHLVANRMAPSVCPGPRGTRWGSWFPAILCHISMAMPHRTDMGTKFHIELTWVRSMCCNYNNRQLTQRRLQLSHHQHHRQTTTDNTPSQLSTFNPGL